MIWICRECGIEVSAADAALVASIGWVGIDGDTGVCAPCRDKLGLPGARPSDLAKARIEHAGRATARSRLAKERVSEKRGS